MNRLSVRHLENSKLTIPPVLTIGSLLFVLLSGQAISEPGDSETEFTFSADPTELIFLLTHDGGMTGAFPVYELYGDGRLVYSHQSIHGKTYEQYEFSLSFAEMKEILQGIVSHGLVEASAEDILKMTGRPSNYGRRSTNDSVMVILEVKLTNYVRLNRDLGPINQKIAIANPLHLHRLHPEIDELRGFFEIYNKMREYRRIARERLGKSKMRSRR